MIANIPNKYTMQSLIAEIDLFGLENKYNFFYVPVDFQVPPIHDGRTTATGAMPLSTSSMSPT